MLVALLKALSVLWPFIKENILGKTQLEEYAKRNKHSFILGLTTVVTLLMFLYMAEEAVVSTYLLRQEQTKVEIISTRLAATSDTLAGVKDWVVDIKSILNERDAEILELKTRLESVVNQRCIPPPAPTVAVKQKVVRNVNLDPYSLIKELEEGNQ